MSRTWGEDPGGFVGAVVESSFTSTNADSEAEVGALGGFRTVRRRFAAELATGAEDDLDAVAAAPT